MAAHEDHTDVAIIGGGPAGLQAALTLGRIHRNAVLFDDGTYRNATVSHMHNVIAQDGTPPEQFRQTARAQLAAYPAIEVRHQRVVEVASHAGPDGAAAGRPFTLHLDGGAVLTADAVVLATGLRDELPPIPGLAEIWGDLAAQCPFCHAHEFTGQRIGVLDGPESHLVTMLGPIASEVVPLPPATVERIVRSGEGLEVHRGDGTREQVAALFVVPVLHQSAPFAAQLGLDLNPSGAVRVDEFARSSVSGVFCAGDMAHLPAYPMPMASVVAAAAAGQLAASSAHAGLMMAAHAGIPHPPVTSHR